MGTLTEKDRRIYQLKACADDLCKETCEKVKNCKVCPINEAIEKLAEYENLDEQGKLLKLPCKLGDTTYWISDEDKNGNKVPTITENQPIIGIAIKENGFYILVDGDEDYQKVGTKWALLTLEEAEEYLKKMNDGDEKMIFDLKELQIIERLLYNMLTYGVGIDPDVDKLLAKVRKQINNINHQVNNASKWVN